MEKARLAGAGELVMASPLQKAGERLTRADLGYLQP
jgi:hypothetical protein